MAELVARHLLQAEVSPLWIVNRTLGRAESLAAELGGEAHSFDRLESLLTRAAVVISSTGARDPVIRAELMSRVMKARRGRWLLLVDIAVPRDIEPQVGKLENVYLYDLDALQQVVSHGQAERQREAESAHHIVVEELLRLGRRARSADVSPVIRALRSQAHELAQAEVARVLPKLGALTDRQKQLVAGLGPSIVNKLLHLPLTALRQQAEQSGGAEGAAELADAIVRLWSLDKLLGTVAEPTDELPSGPVETQAGPSPQNAKDLENSSS
jgi:glutamyl-tRNA reductase